jgi:sepiapterin reductase
MKEKQTPPAVLVITGAGKGIGRAFVESLAHRARTRGRPLKLVLNSRTSSDLDSLKARIESELIECVVAPCDLAEAPTLPVEAGLREFGRMDALIHCAGVGRFKDFLEQTPEDLAFTWNTNVTATFLLLQKAYAALKAQEPVEGLRGQIQVVTSVAAEQPFMQSSSYCMSKYAQRGLLDVLKLYGRRDGIRILEIRPGAAYTPMWGDLGPDQVARMMDATDVAIPMVDALELSPRASLESITVRPLRGDL